MKRIQTLGCEACSSFRSENKGYMTVNFPKTKSEDPSVYEVLKYLSLSLSPKRRLQGLILIKLSLLGVLAELASVGAILPFLQHLGSPQNSYLREYLPQETVEKILSTGFSELEILAIIFLVLIIFAAFYRAFLVWAQLKFGNNVGHDLSVEMFRSSIASKYETHLARDNSEVAATVTVKVNQLLGGFINPIIAIVTNSLIFLGILFLLLALYGWPILYIFGGVALAYLFLAVVTRKKLEKNSYHISSRTDAIVGLVNEALAVIRDVKINGLLNLYLFKYRVSDFELRRAQISSNVLSQTPKFGLEAVALTLFIIFVISSLNSGTTVDGLISMVGVLALGIQRMMPQAQTIYANYSTLRASLGSLRDIVFLLKPGIHSEQIISSEDAHVEFQHFLELKNVSYIYPNSHREVLTGVNLKIRKGQYIGIVGRSSSGKSTLLDLLSGLIAPTNGEICIDGVPARLSPNNSWFKRVGIVSQSPYLINSSILENIVLADYPSNIDGKKLKSAIRMAHLQDLIDKTPEGLELVVGEGGKNLSGGQRQRLAIARAFYKNADILILDEVTSALDTVTEKSVVDYIDSLSPAVTVIAVAHRVHTLKKCNIVFEVRNGTISDPVAFNGPATSQTGVRKS